MTVVNAGSNLWLNPFAADKYEQSEEDGKKKYKRVDCSVKATHLPKADEAEIYAQSRVDAVVLYDSRLKPSGGAACLWTPPGSISEATR